MKSFVIILAAAGLSLTAHAEWYKVVKILNYNTIEAQVSKGSTSKSGITIRIKNLEKIEYIQNDRAKVLLGGAEPKEMLEEIMLGQVVWVEQLEHLNGENTAHVFPSYEQVIRAFMKRRMAGSYTLTPAIKQKIINVNKRMLSNMKNIDPPRHAISSGGDKKNNKAADNNMAYNDDYMKSLYIYDGLDWFKKTGQYLPTEVQAMYVDWLSDYQLSNGTDARALEIKIRDFKKRSTLYRDFLFDAE